MKVIPVSAWDPSHTALSRYLLGRLAQLVDLDEVITHRQPTTNGLILLEELHDTAALAMTHERTTHRLSKLLEECADRKIRTSMATDVVFATHYPQIVDDVQTWGKSPATSTLARTIHIEAGILLEELRICYSRILREEFDALDLNATNFDKTADQIDKLLFALVPLLLHQGHSLAFLQMAPARLARRSFHNLIEMLFRFFSMALDRKYEFFIAGPLDDELARYLNATHATLDAAAFFVPPETTSGVGMWAEGKDPIAALRNTVASAFKWLTLRSSAPDPFLMKPLWENGYYKTMTKYAHFDEQDRRDPILPSSRPNTLETTLGRFDMRLRDIPDSVFEVLGESIYFYNLARQAASVENSYILLWTALEALMEPRDNRADIEVIRESVAPILSIGALGRRVNSTVQRVRLSGSVNKWPYLGPGGASEWTENGLAEWAAWLADAKVKGTDADPYPILKPDPVLCRQYRQINEHWGKYAALKNIVTESHRNLEYQLDRLYLARNRAVHSGHFGHTGTYLWVHLEWYVGKVLAQAVLTLTVSEGISSDPMPKFFGTHRLNYRRVVGFLGRCSGDTLSAEGLRDSGLFGYPAVCF